jgi:hypothetical protein
MVNNMTDLNHPARAINRHAFRVLRIDQHTSKASGKPRRSHYAGNVAKE